MLKLVESFSLAGDPAKPNEDAFGGSDQAAVVLDGATMLGDGLMPGPSDAAWIAQFGARRLIAHLKDWEPKKALKLALGDVEKSFGALRRAEPEEYWQVPVASMMLFVEIQASLPLSAKRDKGEVAVAGSRVSEGRRGLEFLYFGDCGALVEQPDGLKIIGETLDKRAEESARAAALAKEKNISPASGLSRPEFIGHLRAARNRVEKGAYLLLATDGFLSLASDYGAYDAAGLLAAAKTKGLKALGDEIRAIENADMLGDKFARFKKSDDATALLLTVE